MPHKLNSTGSTLTDPVWNTGVRLVYYIKSKPQLSEMVDGSNESLYNPDEELDPNLRRGIPFQKSFEKVDVPYEYGAKFKN